MGHWSFAKKSFESVRRDPFEAEFFVGDEESEEVFGRTDSLVREAIQNSLDARNDGEPVHIRFAAYTENEAPTLSRLRDYLGGLLPHLEASGNDWLKDGIDSKPFRWLVYEDFGTRGLCGDPGRVSDPPSDGSAGRQEFYWFWRNIGRSGKSGQDLGRWGLGKSVLPATSCINTMFGLTVRSDDGRRLLMGQSVLKMHDLNDQPYEPEGFFHGSRNEKNVPLPIDDPALCDQFCKDFRLKRGQSDAGLSVVVPFCFPTLSARELLRSVVVHYFIPILRGRLIAEVEGPGLPLTRVDQKSVESVAGTLSWDGRVGEKKHAPPPFEFARWAIDQQTSKQIPQLRLAGEHRAPQWNDDLFPSDLLKQSRSLFGEGERVALRAPIRITYRDGNFADSYFDAFLWREQNLERGEDHFVREGMTISGVQTLRSRRGVRGLVLVDDKVLSSLLGDAEGPAHENWGTGESRPDQTYATWKRRVSFVKNSLLNLTTLLTPPPEELDRELLTEVFGLESVAQPGRRGQQEADIGDVPKPEVPDIRRRPQWYRLEKVQYGFRVRHSGEVPVPSGAKLRIQVAYDIPSGDPFSNWSPFDFDFRERGSEFQVTGRGVQAKARNGNEIQLEINSEEFVLKIVGFDHARDLCVRVDEFQAEESEDEDLAPVAAFH